MFNTLVSRISWCRSFTERWREYFQCDSYYIIKDVQTTWDGALTLLSTDALCLLPEFFSYRGTSAEKFPFLGHFLLALSIKWSYCLDLAFKFEPISEKQPEGKIGKKKTSKFSLFLHLRKNQMRYPLSVTELKIQSKHCIWDYMESGVKT